jgi:hypothetical protein
MEAGRELTNVDLADDNLHPDCFRVAVTARSRPRRHAALRARLDAPVLRYGPDPGPFRSEMCGRL